MRTKYLRSFLYAGIILSLVLSFSKAHAVPSFARQTGAECSACHTVFFELTQFGRIFKLRGYTMTNVTQGQVATLSINYYPPVSAMLLVSLTETSKNQPGTQNGNGQLPDTLSLFYAGRISEKLGAYAQVSYTQPSDHITMDNTDIRFATDAWDTVFGLTLNNNPTVQDLWNSTPAWSFPFASSAVAPAPAASVKLMRALGQKVAGLGAYAFWNNLIYAEATVYRSARVGGNQPPNNTDTDIVDGTAPYWRLAAEKNWGSHTLEVGTYGMYVKVFPTGATGTSDHFMDYAFDAQYQYIGDPHVFTAHTTWIYEKQNLDASFPAGQASYSTNTLQTFRIDGIYYYKRKIGGSIGYFNTWGDTDPLRYGPAPVTGSATGSPDSSGFIVELDYLPWQNTKFIVQYTYYDQFNGGRSNYDGAGRRATDNNTLYVAAWIMF